MKNKAVFLDRDGTINADTDYIYKIADFNFLPGVKDGLRLLSEAGFTLIVITNQSGIARGMYSEADYMRLNEWMISDLKKAGIEIAASYFCPHHPDGYVRKYKIECACRKPKTGLFEKACSDFEIDKSQSYAIGDRMRDLTFCTQSLVRGVLLYNDKEERIGNIMKITGGLKEAAEIIINGDFK